MAEGEGIEPPLLIKAGYGFQNRHDTILSPFRKSTRITKKLYPVIHYPSCRIVIMTTITFLNKSNPYIIFLFHKMAAPGGFEPPYALTHRCFPSRYITKLCHDAKWRIATVRPVMPSFYDIHPFSRRR